jgi:hypothetical protein
MDTSCASCRRSARHPGSCPPPGRRPGCPSVPSRYSIEAPVRWPVIWLTPTPSPHRAALPGHDTRGAGTFNWPKTGTQIWPPMGTFSWPRTPLVRPLSAIWRAGEASTTAFYSGSKRHERPKNYAVRKARRQPRPFVILGRWAELSSWSGDAGVDGAEGRGGEGGEHTRMGRHRFGDAFAADEPGSDQLVGAGPVGLRARRADPGAPADQIRCWEQSLATRFSLAVIPRAGSSPAMNL